MDPMDLLTEVLKAPTAYRGSRTVRDEDGNQRVVPYAAKRIPEDLLNRIREVSRKEERI